MANNETKYNKIVGIKGNEIYVLEYTFEDSDKFKGAVGYSMCPLYQSDIDYMSDVDYEEYKYLWQDAVANDRTELGLEEYLDMLNDEAKSYGKYGICDDDSFRCEFNDMIKKSSDEVKAKIKEVFGDNVVDWNCSGCGRSFNKNDKYDVVFNQSLIDEINRVEE